MEEILQLTKINVSEVIIGVFIILSAFVSIFTLISKVSEIVGKPFKWVRDKNADHNLLVQTVENLTELQNEHKEDVKQSILHDRKIQDELSSFMAEMKESIFQTQSEIKQFAENRVNDRRQSFQIQKELTDSIKAITENDKNREKQIDSLTAANRELLAGKINDKYKYFVSIGGIPEDEVDEFTSLHSAYNACGGNHHGDAKYNYVMEHLPVISVETKLVYKD